MGEDIGTRVVGKLGTRGWGGGNRSFLWGLNWHKSLIFDNQHMEPNSVNNMSGWAGRQSNSGSAPAAYPGAGA